MRNWYPDSGATPDTSITYASADAEHLTERYAVVMNRAETNIETVEVNREKLLRTLEENLDKHKTDYENAMAGYRAEKERKLEALHIATAAAVEQNSEENRRQVHLAYREFNNLPRPQDHSDSYELAIEIMRWETKEKVELSINDFQCYVRDRWNWKDQFRISVANYASHSHA